MSKKRKLQKYINKISKSERKKDTSVHDRSNVRLSIPFNMCCEACLEQIPVGKRYYATKATSSREDYLGVEVYVFEFKCPECRLPIRFKTDPKSGVYICDYNCRKTEAEKEGTPFKILKNQSTEDSITKKRDTEIRSIRKFLRSSRNADIDKVKQELERHFEQ